jgi:hypothetical protein
MFRYISPRGSCAREYPQTLRLRRTNLELCLFGESRQEKLLGIQLSYFVPPYPLIDASYPHVTLRTARVRQTLSKRGLMVGRDSYFGWDPPKLAPSPQPTKWLANRTSFVAN